MPYIHLKIMGGINGHIKSRGRIWRMSLIEIRGLKKSFGENEVLKGIDLSIGKGEIIGYIGPNGAGKSTTVKIMLGLIEEFEGDVYLFGEDIRKASASYKRHIGYVPEAGEIYDTLTGHEYLSFLGELYSLKKELIEARIERLMILFGLQEVMHSRISSYSKGMRQKILIIASIIHNPEVLFLDEPIAGLDANSVMVFKELLHQLAKNGKTIFYSSHMMDVVEKISDRIVLIDQGIIAADGNFDTLNSTSQYGSLEELFNKVTGTDNHEEIAKSIIETISGDDVWKN